MSAGCGDLGGGGDGGGGGGGVVPEPGGPAVGELRALGGGDGDDRLGAGDGAMRGHVGLALSFPAGAFRLNAGVFARAGERDAGGDLRLLGYYNVTFLGAEVVEPAKTIPRAILISIGLVTVLYLGMNFAILTVVPWRAAAGGDGVGGAAGAGFVLYGYGVWGACGGAGGGGAGDGDGVCECVFAAAGLLADTVCGGAGREFLSSVWAAARHAGVSLCAAAVDGWYGNAVLLFELGEVIAALVVLRISVQFLLQHVGVMLLRRREPERARPFRIWLYPVPPLVAVVGFGYILVGRAHFGRELWMAAVVVVLGAGAYGLRRVRSGEAGA